MVVSWWHLLMPHSVILLTEDSPTEKMSTFIIQSLNFNLWLEVTNKQWRLLPFDCIFTCVRSGRMLIADSADGTDMLFLVIRD